MLRPKKFLPATQKIESAPAPIGGLNARDSIAAMSPDDAVNLVNWIPDTFGIKARKGYRNWAINFPGAAAVSAVFGYFATNTVIPGGAFLTDPTAMPGKLFAATQAGIYDITSTTNAPALAQALSNTAQAGWFSTVQLSNIAGTYLLACSETDGYFTYDGTAWLKRVGGAGAGEINGVAPGELVQVVTFKRRAWFVRRNSASAYYLAADAIAGTATEFNFGPLFKHGGHLSYLGNWTIDAGEGIDDFLVAVGSNGDVLVYKGTDPASAATFGLVGSWYVGQIPVGRRAMVQFGGDLIIISADGVYPVSYVTRGGADFLQASAKEYSSKIRSVIGADLRASFTERGWQAIVHPSERLLIINVPDYAAVRNRQYAMSTTQNVWSLFADIPIYCMGSTAGYTFAGTRDGRVLLLFSGYFDNVAYGASVGSGIRGVVQPAFSSFGTPALDKQFLMIRPTFLAMDAPGIQAGINVNYSITEPLGSPTFTSSGSSLWDVSSWGSAVWGGALKSFASWISVGGVGFSGAATLVTTCAGDTTLVSIDYMLAAGGPL